MDVGQGDPLHVRAQVAGLDEFHVGEARAQVVGHRAFGDQRHPLRPFAFQPGAHGGGRADEVGLVLDLGRAFGMGDQARVEALARMPRLLRGELLVHFAAAVPQHQRDPGLLGDVVAEEAVGQEDHRVRAVLGGHRLNHLGGVGRGAAGVGLGLHLGAGVDVADHRRAGMAPAQSAHVGGGDRGRQRAAGLRVGDQHGLARSQDLGALGHEVDAGQHDQSGVAVGGGLGQGQRIAGDVGHAVEDLRRLVAVGHDHRAALALEAGDGVDPRQVQRPFQTGQQGFEPGPEFGVALLQFRVPAQAGAGLRRRRARAALSHCGGPRARRAAAGCRAAGRCAGPAAGLPRAGGRAGCARSGRARCRR